MMGVIKISRTYEWTRFWCPSDKKPIISPEGYLVDPEFEFSPNSHLIINPIKLEQNCIVLLGAPGIGKTESLTIHEFEQWLVKWIVDDYHPSCEFPK